MNRSVPVRSSLGVSGLYAEGHFDLGYVRQDSDPYDNNYSGGWKGKNGIDSAKEFLASESAQDKAAEAWVKLMWHYIEAENLDQHAWTEVGGVELTPSGMLAASHLMGTYSLQAFIDSDGKIDHFVSHREIKRTLELHDIADGDEYYLAAFLVGAYQETLGDLHNLFGDTHVVHIRLEDDGSWSIEEVVKGDTANKVLEYMEYDVEELYPALSRDCERAIREGRMTVAESQALKRFYEGELNGYAYLE